jgi:hypothetical protein
MTCLSHFWLEQKMAWKILVIGYCWISIALSSTCSIAQDFESGSEIVTDCFGTLDFPVFVEFNSQLNAFSPGQYSLITSLDTPAGTILPVMNNTFITSSSGFSSSITNTYDPCVTPLLLSSSTNGTFSMPMVVHNVALGPLGKSLHGLWTVNLYGIEMTF